MDLLVDLPKVRLVNSLLHALFKLGWQLQVFVLKSEVDFEEVVEAKFLCKRVVKLDVFELLEEEDKDLEEALWVFIRHG